MMKKIENFMLPEHTNTLYEREAISSISLTKEVADKINEIVDSINHLSQADLEWKQTQEGTIRKGIIYMKDNLANSLNDLMNMLLENGYVDDRIKRETALLTAQVNNLLGKVVEGSTTGDAELIDGRVDLFGEVHPNIGTAIRDQIRTINDFAVLSQNDKISINFNTVNKKIEIMNGPMLFYHSRRYILENQSVDYAEPISRTNTFYLVMNRADSTLSTCHYASFDRETMIPILLINHASIEKDRYGIIPYIGNYSVNGNPVEVDVSTSFLNIGYMFSGESKPFIYIDRANKTISFTGNVYVCSESERYDINTEPILSYANLNKTTFYLVFNTAREELECVDIANYNPTQHIFLFQFQTNALTNPNANTIPFSYYVDNVLVTKYESNPGVAIGETTYHVDGVNGSNNNSGAENSPLKTIQRAIDIGATNIAIKPGIYRELLSAKNREKLKMFANWSTFNNDTNQHREKVVIEMGEDISAILNTTTNLYEAEYNSVADDVMHRVFIDKTLEPLVEGSRTDGYYTTIWNVETSDRVIPVLSLEECQNTEQTFFYDGNKIYIHSIGTEYKLVASEFSGMSSFVNVDNVILEDIVFQYQQNSGLYVKDCTMQVRNCEFNHSSLGDGLRVVNVNGVFDDCIAHHNRNDGFNLHGFGDTTFNNCYGYSNFDDGISHHDGCTGTINGGRWYNNGKGGISSPTHGARVDVYNAVTHNNYYGVLASGDDGNNLDQKIIVAGCAIYNNGVGISTNYTEVLSINNRIANNDTDTIGNVVTI